MLASTESPVKSKRTIVKKHKDALIGNINAKQRHQLRMLLIKLHKDYRQVSSKRGSRNFSLGRWLDSNLK